MKIILSLALVWAVFFVISPLDTKSWSPSKSPSPSYSKKTLRSLKAVGRIEIAENKGIGLEDMEIDGAGLVYTGLDNGDFMSVDSSGKDSVCQHRWAHSWHG